MKSPVTSLMTSPAGGIRPILRYHGLAALLLILALGLTTPCRASNLFVSNGTNNTIEQFTPGGVGSVFTNTGLSNLQGLAFDSAGNLYVANRTINTIEQFTSGGVGSVFANTGLNSPIGLAFDGADNLYAANYAANTIEKFTPGGVGSVFANTGLSNPTFLAFAPAPEPSTWALFAIGSVALLLASAAATAIMVLKPAWRRRPASRALA